MNDSGLRAEGRSYIAGLVVTMESSCCAIGPSSIVVADDVVSRAGSQLEHHDGASC